MLATSLFAFYGLGPWETGCLLSLVLILLWKRISIIVNTLREREETKGKIREKIQDKKRKAEEALREEPEFDLGEETISQTKDCPFCAEEIKAEAIKCKHCGEFVNYQRKPVSQNKYTRTQIRMGWAVLAFIVTAFVVSFKPGILVVEVIFVGAFWAVIAYIIVWELITIEGRNE